MSTSDLNLNTSRYYFYFVFYFAKISADKGATTHTKPLFVI